LIRFSNELSPARVTNSGVMVGLGEETDELLEVFRDLAAAGCDILTFRLYLRPFQAIIHVHLANRVTDHPFHLTHLRRQGVAVIGTSRKVPGSDEPSATIADRHADLVAKLVRLSRLALGDALHRRLMHAVDLVFVMPLLGMDVARRLK
jgi:hypothetical protein